MGREKRTDSGDWLLDAIVENIPDMVFVKDAENLAFCRFNRAGEELLGIPRAEMLGKTDLDFFPKNEAEFFREKDRETLRGRVVVDIPEEPIQTQRGPRWLHTKKVPITDENGKPIFLLGISEDITERKRTEHALRVAHDAAEAQARELAVRERAAEVLQETDRRKNEFLAVLSHELRNPLVPLSASLTILERVAPGTEQWQHAHAVVKRQVGQLSRLVDDLLDITRISRGKITLRLNTLELNELVRRAVEDHRLLFQEKGVTLTLEETSGSLTVSGDRERLTQMIGNLLQNAAKFTPREGRVMVTIGTDRSGGNAVLVVGDTGVGIVPEVLPQLFSPFTQAEKTLDRTPGGLGLGLALVKRLAEMHGGAVEARSEGAGKGAQLLVTLPLVQRMPAEEPPNPAAGRAPRRVLVIEDSVDSAQSLREVLELGGDRVEVALDGNDGVAKAHTFRPEIVLCDIGLPGMDGYAVARALRQDPDVRTAFLIALSGYALPEDRAKARAAGFDEHVAKPPRWEVLERLLAEAPLVP